MFSSEIEAPNGKEITDKKLYIIRCGIGRSGGSIKTVSENMKRTIQNTILHIKQCKSMYGFDYEIDGDRYWIRYP